MEALQVGVLSFWRPVLLSCHTVAIQTPSHSSASYPLLAKQSPRLRRWPLPFQNSLPEELKRLKTTMQEDRVIWLLWGMFFKPTNRPNKNQPPTFLILSHPSSLAPSLAPCECSSHDGKAQPVSHEDWGPGPVPHWVLTAALWGISARPIFHVKKLIRR